MRQIFFIKVSYYFNQSFQQNAKIARNDEKLKNSKLN